MKNDLAGRLKKYAADPVYASGAVFCVAAGALAFALVMQYVFGLAPCDLCIWQRVPFAVAGLLGLAGLVTALNPDWMKVTSFLVFIAGIAFLAGGAVAFYHTGVEQHWWRSFLEGCSVKLPDDPADFMAFIENNQATPCDQIPWQFLGLSMAAWNAIISPVLAVLAAGSAVMLARRANNFL